MKVERKTSFTPVVITLETEDELESMKLCLGSTSKHDIERVYETRYGKDVCGRAHNFGYDLFCRIG